MVFPSALKKTVSSISRAQWVVIIFVVIAIPTVTILVYGLTLSDDSSSTPTYSLADKYGPVIYVNMMYRHGERNPDDTPPKDSYGDVKYWPGGFGSLTAKGILAHYHLGKWIAERYRHLLPADWTLNNNAIKVYSTDWKRTLMSAQANLAGMFPITGDASMWEGLSSYPIPIHSIPAADDGLLELSKECKKYKSLVLTSRASEEYQKIMREYQNVTDYVEQNSGELIKGLQTYRILYTTYFIEESRGFALPNWLGKVYPSPMRELAVSSHVWPTRTTEMKRLRGGPFLKEVLRNFHGKLNGSDSLNMTVYSAHDTSLSAAMGALGVFNDEFPPFAALFLLELRMTKNETEPVVMLWYKNTTSDPFMLHLPGCTAACPLSQMELLLEPVIPDDWDKECQGMSYENLTVLAN
uniref:acid phosphatase n=1 Tax=Lygus hesperus TaxID=30085 RepID=A0A0A9YKS5_LYGHE